MLATKGRGRLYSTSVAHRNLLLSRPRRRGPSHRASGVGIGGVVSQRCGLQDPFRVESGHSARKYIVKAGCDSLNWVTVESTSQKSFLPKEGFWVSQLTPGPRVSTKALISRSGMCSAMGMFATDFDKNIVNDTVKKMIRCAWKNLMD